jgi:hypothetical protein
LTVHEAPSSCCGRTSGELWESLRFVPLYSTIPESETDRCRRVWDGNTTRSTSPSRTFCSSSESCLFALNNFIQLTSIQAPDQLPTSSALEVTAHDEDDGDDFHDARLPLDSVPLRISDPIATQATASSEPHAYSDPFTTTEHSPSLKHNPKNIKYTFPCTQFHQTRAPNTDPVSCVLNHPRTKHMLSHGLACITGSCLASLDLQRPRSSAIQVMDDDGHLLVSPLCSYLHIARRFLALRYSALWDRSIAFVGFCVFLEAQSSALQVLSEQQTR